jgi:ubiquinone/menaquinone biosynthesis C-methylase UbiE
MEIITSVSHAGALDSSLRRRLQNPLKFLNTYIKRGMKILDLGCGTGFCTFDIAQLLNGEGEVVAADLQQGMLNILSNKAEYAKYKNLIKLHRCNENSIGLQNEKFDFILVFYVFHEMPEHNKVLQEIKSLLNPEGKVLMVEPKFHVNKNEFQKTKEQIREKGFRFIGDSPKVFLSRSVLFHV